MSTSLFRTIAGVAMAAVTLGFVPNAKAAEPLVVDKIITNAVIHTVDDNNPSATAMAIKDGKIVYVGSDAGAADYVGPTEDMKGRFVMPGIIDAHSHVAMACEEIRQMKTTMIEAEGLEDILAFIRAEVADDPDRKEYRFYLDATALRGERLLRTELDKICSDRTLLVTEVEGHSMWMNTYELRQRGIGEFEADIAPNLSYFERDADGRVNGRIYEFATNNRPPLDIKRAVYERGIGILAHYWKKWGVVATFDAGQYTSTNALVNFCDVLSARQASGDFPVYVEGCYYLYDPAQLTNAVSMLREFDAKYNTDMLRVRTMKMMLDGTIAGRTAALFDKYEDVPGNGGLLVSAERLAEFLCELNAAGIDFHVHTVGDRAVVTVQDATEMAQKAVKDAGGEFRIKVTAAHVETLPEEYLSRFAKLGIIVNFTPSWFDGEDFAGAIGEERASNMYRAKTVWDSGALVTFSTDEIALEDMKAWNPYHGMEVGRTRQTCDADGTGGGDYRDRPVFPPVAERLTMERMIRGFTINAARQLHLEDRIGSLTVGKDASYLVFSNNLFDVEVYQLHKQLPEEVWIRGRRMCDDLSLDPSKPMPVYATEIEAEAKADAFRVVRWNAALSNAVDAAAYANLFAVSYGEGAGEAAGSYVITCDLKPAVALAVQRTLDDERSLAQLAGSVWEKCPHASLGAIPGLYYAISVLTNGANWTTAPSDWTLATNRETVAFCVRPEGTDSLPQYRVSATAVPRVGAWLESESVVSANRVGEGVWAGIHGTACEVGGSGGIWDADQWPGGRNPLDAYRATMTRVVVGEGVTHVGSHAFDAFGAITNASLSGSVTHVGAGAFANCAALERLTFAAPMEDMTLGEDAIAFVTSIEMAGGVPVLTTKPAITFAGEWPTLMGAERLDAPWEPVAPGHEADYHFFRHEVK